MTLVSVFIHRLSPPSRLHTGKQSPSQTIGPWTIQTTHHRWSWVQSRALLPCIQAWLELMMSTNAGFSDAPPTKKPSMSACFASSPLFFSVTLPPYRMRVFSAASAETSFFSQSRMAAWTSCACSVVATLPVPMALCASSVSIHRQKSRVPPYQMGS